MRESPPSRLGIDSRRDSVWENRRGRLCWAFALVPCLLFSFSTTAVGATEWQEEDNAVNVISVENMDALLGLRMVTELKSFEGIFTKESEPEMETEAGPVDEPQLNETETRFRRTVDSRLRIFPNSSSRISDLCSVIFCRCVSFGIESLNITCDFQNHEVDLGSGSVPAITRELRISNAKNLKILPGTFSDHSKLQGVEFIGTENLTIFSFAFQNLSNVPFKLEIKDCINVNLDEHSFRNLKKPMKVVIANCEHVSLDKYAFYWFNNVQIINVLNLEVFENTFATEVKQDFESTQKLVLFLNVSINEIPNATFPLSSAKIVFYGCNIEAIGSGAFSGIALASVYFKSTKLNRLLGGAFSERTLIQNVEFDDVDIQFVDSNTLSAAARLTIRNSRIEEMANRAFNVNTAYLKLLNNDFRKIRRYAFEIHNWNSIVIEGNRFKILEPDSFSVPFSNITSVTTEFTFSNNTLSEVGIDVLMFIPSEPGLDVFLNNNTFDEPCHCHLEAWIRERSGKSWESFYETSFCIISDLLVKCYNVSKGTMNMKEYMEEFCTPENMIICEEISKSFRPSIFTSLDLHNTERTVLGVIFLGVVCSIAIMITILALMWMRDRGGCGKKRKSTPANSDFFCSCSRFCNTGNLVTTNSISQVNIHEYAEIQNQLNHQQKQTALIDEIAEDEEEILAYENKATQTIPEELTHELIQSLKEKLDDPENYNEARDMIEHLYDLIKVEERCNNNNVSPTTSLIFDEDDDFGGIYEVIQTNKSSSPRNVKAKKKSSKAEVVSTGTRAPSPDKLSPLKFTIIRPLPTVVSDYVEPRDRKSNEYCELPTSNLIMPDVLTSSQIKDNHSLPKTHIYAEPLQNMARRPLPSEPWSGTSKL